MVLRVRLGTTDLGIWCRDLGWGPGQRGREGFWEGWGKVRLVTCWNIS